jgi:formate dehydrogenase subunit gamma
MSLESRSPHHGIDPVWDEAQASAIIARLAKLEGAMLPILHALQEAFGFVPPPSFWKWFRR